MHDVCQSCIGTYVFQGCYSLPIMYIVSQHQHLILFFQWRNVAEMQAGRVYGLYLISY